MVKQYKKGAASQLSEHFNSREFDCRCTRPECQVTLIADELIVALELLRPFTGPISIDDGYRCPAHNAEVPGAAPGSRHPKGEAADIRTALSPFETAEAANRVPGFSLGGIGIYNAFTHVDVRGYRARWEMKKENPR